MNKDFTKEADTPDIAAAWSRMTYKEKNRVLFERQKRLLEMFLARGAIDQAQYEKSMNDLTTKFKEF